MSHAIVSLLYYTTLHYATLHYTTLHYTTPHHTIPYHTIPYHTIEVGKRRFTVVHMEKDMQVMIIARAVLAQKNVTLAVYLGTIS